MRTPTSDEQPASEPRELARTTDLTPQPLGFLPTTTFWRKPGALGNARWLFIAILVVGALPYAASGLPAGSSFLLFTGICYFGLGFLERYVRGQANRRMTRVLRGASPDDSSD
jgi:hypothetical protein